MRELVNGPEVVALARRWMSSPKSWYEYTADGAFNRLAVTDLAESWDDLIDWSKRCSNWGFRGQREASWTLQTSLERDAAHGGIRVSYSYGNISGCRPLNRQMVGEKLLSGFRKLASAHIENLPPHDDLASWLSLMQHYGGPTRLLDWTECPFVGTYFALGKSRSKGIAPPFGQ